MTFVYLHTSTMNKKDKLSTLTVKIYHGYGHTNNCTLFGHVFAHNTVTRQYDRSSVWQNIVHLIRLFIIRPVPGIPVRLSWNKQQFLGTTEADGFFKFEWQSSESVPAGWHSLTVDALTDTGTVMGTGTGKIFVPHVTQIAVISDIDDTVLISHSSTLFKRLKVLFTRTPRSRKAFTGIVELYQWLAQVRTDAEMPNPFFYVSSSEWNLYDDLVEFFRFNRLPEGSFLLNQVKRWYELFRTGKTKHQGKLLRILRIMKDFPHQHFILIGDNSQSDPGIYQSIAEKYPDRVMAVYIRSVVAEHDIETQKILQHISQLGISTCLFKHSEEALLHAKKNIVQM